MVFHYGGLSSVGLSLGWSFIRVVFHQGGLLVMGSTLTWSVADIDECLGNNGGCEQLCVNSEGSFSCACNQGYILSPDGQRCLRESMYLFFRMVLMFMLYVGVKLRGMIDSLVPA